MKHSVLDYWVRKNLVPKVEEKEIFPLFTSQDFKNMRVFIMELARTYKTPLSNCIVEHFSSHTRGLISSYNTCGYQDEYGPIPPKSFQKTLISELNQVIQNVSLYDYYDETRQMIEYRNIFPLTKAMETLIKKNPKGKDLIYLNRLVLEEAYRDAIARGRKGRGKTTLLNWEGISVAYLINKYKNDLYANFPIENLSRWAKETVRLIKVYQEESDWLIQIQASYCKELGVPRLDEEKACRLLGDLSWNLMQKGLYPFFLCAQGAFFQIGSKCKWMGMDWGDLGMEGKIKKRGLSRLQKVR